jgi:hypothetical protein
VSCNAKSHAIAVTLLAVTLLLRYFAVPLPAVTLLLLLRLLLLYWLLLCCCFLRNAKSRAIAVYFAVTLPAVSLLLLLRLLFVTLLAATVLLLSSQRQEPRDCCSQRKWC